MSYLEQLFSLEGKVALVTGASRGLGRAAAVALAGAGATVALIGRDQAALKEVQQQIAANRSEQTDRSYSIACDVKDPEKMMEALATIIQRSGTIDILINNAGIIRRSPATDYTAHDWYDVIDTNLNAVFSWAQAIGKVMVDQGSGKIINMASLMSFQGGLNIAAYAAAKGGVAQLTKALANEWAKYNINVNAIAPGYMLTNATAALRSNAERSKQVFSRIPAARWGEPEDLAGAIIYLASSASDYVNGHVLVVDGGWLGY
ncbi:MAG: glucose 1-dehydrogenase [Bacteroidota bacterium]|nr:glucose 1-dehydrogenase [Bacteroidota bacterium]MDP4232116.1 glucose 1-dehydrogenase [Bacteroidota bacterium]MDP4241176.1 glucose 1-dehydrogenase [Bacteroidota bacterium]MDP4286568.1 glucose 1-dehydrogenase [Bacteroidota bacterium]